MSKLGVAVLLNAALFGLGVFHASSACAQSDIKPAPYCGPWSEECYKILDLYYDVKMRHRDFVWQFGYPPYRLRSQESAYHWGKVACKMGRDLSIITCGEEILEACEAGWLL